MCPLFFFEIYCLEHIYYPAGSRNPTLAYDNNKDVGKVSKIKMKNNIKTLPPGFQLLLVFFLFATAGERASTFRQEVNVYFCFI